MKIKELRLKTDVDLDAFLGDLYEKLRLMRFDLSQGKVKNTALLRGIRKDIARIETIKLERKLQKS